MSDDNNQAADDIYATVAQLRAQRAELLAALEAVKPLAIDALAYMEFEKDHSIWAQVLNAIANARGEST